MAQKKSAQSTIFSEKSNGLVIVDAYVKKKHNETTKVVEARNTIFFCSLYNIGPIAQ